MDLHIIIDDNGVKINTDDVIQQNCERVFIPDLGNKEALRLLKSENKRLTDEINKLRKMLNERPSKTVIKREVIYTRDTKIEHQLREANANILRLREKIENMKKDLQGEPGKRIRELKAALAYERQEHLKTLERDNRRIGELEDNIEGLKEANRNQALYIDQLIHQKGIKPKQEEYSPTKKDLQLIAKNLHLFIGHNEFNPEVL